MKTYVKEFAREIYGSEGVVKLYDLNQKYGTNPVDVLFSAKLFEKVGIGRVERDNFIIADNAREWLDLHRVKLFLDRRAPWSVIERPRRDPAEPYMPHLGKVDVYFFIDKVVR